MLARRPEAAPGIFKTQPNRAGDTELVHPDYVLGTLRKGMELYRDLRAGLPRAIFMMFLVADVHPFVDGNGRMARIMMNAELQAAGQLTRRNWFREPDEARILDEISAGPGRGPA